MRENFPRKNGRRFYCDFANSRHHDTADILNMFRFHRDISAIFFAERIAPKIAVNSARLNEFLCCNSKIVFIILKRFKESVSRYDHARSTHRMADVSRHGTEKHSGSYSSPYAMANGHYSPSYKDSSSGNVKWFDDEVRAAINSTCLSFFLHVRVGPCH